MGTTNCSTAVLESLWLTYMGRPEADMVGYAREFKKATGLDSRGFGLDFQGHQWVEAIEAAHLGQRVNPLDVKRGDIASSGAHRFFISEVNGGKALILEANVAGPRENWKTTPAINEDRWIPLTKIKAAARLFEIE